MASTYPGTLDTFSTARQSGDTIQAGTDNDHSDAINKIEAELGANTSRVVQNNRTQGGTLAAPTTTEMWRFQPRDPAKAPFAWEISGAEFNGTWDTVMLMGYNVQGAGGRIVSSEPAFYWAIEQDYEPNPDVHWVEAYWHWSHPTGGEKRPIFWRFDRSTGDMVGFDIRHNGISFNDWGNDAQVMTIAPKSAFIDQKGHASQTTDGGIYLGAQNGKTVSLTMNGAHGAFQIGSLASNQWYISASGTIMQLSPNRVMIGGSDLGQGGMLTLQVQDAQKGNLHTILCKKIAGQTTSLLGIVSDTGAWYSRFNVNGYFMTQKTSAPADTELDAGEMALWFDSTSGSAKLMIKAKDLGGTVRTGSVSLT